MKAQALTYHLAENPVDDDHEPLSTYFPDEEVNSIEEIVPDDSHVWKMYFDGPVNIKGVGIWAILISPIVHHYPTTTQLRFFYTNNMAKYGFSIMGLKMALDLDMHELLVMVYYDFLIRQSQGEWETRDIKLIPYRQCVQDLSKRFKTIEFRELLAYYGARLLQHLRKCHQCQIHGNLIHLPPSELNPISSTWTFVAWGMDIIGPIDPKASNGHKFILIAIDYFTKWVEAVTFKVVTKKAMVDFVHTNIICRFGIPKTIITDNAANLNSHLMKEFHIRIKKSLDHQIVGVSFDNVSATQRLRIHLLNLGSGKQATEIES
ncbi:uncharacterized protein [Nicotiana tomentosiformis]|uniref:uncharacterized protein n=1 Tax=Nicotiana tomentosiformis TaxID=4098 RepID=UPI00388C6C8D